MGTPVRPLILAWILVILAPGLFFSCEKDELTKPAQVTFHFKLDRISPGNGSITFASGNMDIRSIAFIGDRDNGEDVAFISDFGSIVRADLATGNTDPRIVFDIPQGTYREITLLVNPDDTYPDIVVKGEYTPWLMGSPVPLQIEIDLSSDMTVLARSSDGNSEITLRKDSHPSIDIFLNPSRWFVNFPMLALETAELQNIRGVPSVLISKDFNPVLYSKLSGLVLESAEAVFQ